VEGARFVYKVEDSYPNASFFNLGSVGRFQGGSVNVDEKKNITTLFLLTSNWNLAFHSVMNIGN
jgi:hypothetical protein